MSNIKIPKLISFNDLKKLNSFSPQTFKKFSMNTENYKTTKELLIKKEKGKEVGSFSYISDSNKFFIKTKALKNSTYLPILDDESCVTPILPSSFKKINLKKERILISIDSKFEASFINKDLDNYMISGGLICLEFEKKLIYYIFAFMKSEFFKNQLEMAPKGATIQHIKSLWLETKIPLPTSEDILLFITSLVKSILRKEEMIKIKHAKILKLIDDELKNNQNSHENNNKTSFNDIYENRFDAAPYSIKAKKFKYLIYNYSYGIINLDKLGFDVIRGPNLAIKHIGKSIIQDKPHKNFYSVIKPKDISKYGTIDGIEYMGNKNQLKLLEKGDIIFGAEGFKKGRSYIVLNETDKLITNYHGVIIKHKNNDLITSIFTKCFLDYLRHNGIIDILGTGGNGGSFSPVYLNKLNFPNFPVDKQKEISKLYHNKISYDKHLLQLDSFDKHDKVITKCSGIRQLDAQIKIIKKQLNILFEKILNDKNPLINYNFLLD